MQMKRVLMAAFVFTLLCGGALAQGTPQDSTAPKAPTAPAPQSPPLRTYKLDFSINELEGGAKVNSRQYSMVVNNLGRPGDVRVGTRVPTGVKSDGTPQYLDVNTQISTTLYNRGGVDAVDVNCNVASVAPGSDSGTERPILRTLGITGGTILVEGKPIVLGVADDPNSKRQFQLVVTVTELK
jgi:hypothetical protein